MKLNFFKILFKETLTCSFCHREILNGSYYCENCLAKLPYNNKTKCVICGRHTPSASLRCEHCAVENQHFDKCFSVFNYEKPIRGAILKLKFANKLYLAKELGETFLTYAYKNADINADVIIYVPMFFTDEKKRGFNQSRLLAQALAGNVNVKVEDNIISKIKKSDKQSTLNRKMRESNLKGCFVLNDKDCIKDKTVLVVDDVMTTGATFNEIARILRKGRPKSIYCLSIASVPDKEFLPPLKKKSLFKRIKEKLFNKKSPKKNK